jgi:acetyltransferase-like isoleucine patch superfamily enzyme
MLRLLTQTILLLTPWFIRRRLLCLLFGYRIDKTAHIGFSLILASQIEMDAFASIGNLNFCRRINRLSLGQYAVIGSLNYITGMPEGCTTHFAHCISRRCELAVHEHSALTSRHFIDCTGGITVGAFTTIAGVRSQILTHSIDLERCRQDAKPVQIGAYCFIGTGCTILPGGGLPDRSVLGAMSLLNKSFDDPEWLYGGVPARPVKKLDQPPGSYFHRSRGYVN